MARSSAATTGNADLIRRLRQHAMDRSNAYIYLTADAAKALADADVELARIHEVLDELRGGYDEFYESGNQSRLLNAEKLVRHRALNGTEDGPPRAENRDAV